MKFYDTLDISKAFLMFVEFDKTYDDVINRYMCTDFCICPGTPSDSWYKIYKAVDEKTYNLYQRSWDTGLNRFGEIKIDRKDTAVKPMFWASNPTTGKPMHVKLASESFL